LVLNLDIAKYNPKSRVLDSSVWTVGSGSIGVFNVCGSTTENYRVSVTEPFGTTVIWEARPDATSGADGGWDSSRFDIDKTKTYRFSTWIRRTVLGNGSYYLGCYGYDNNGTHLGVLNRSDGATNTNPYFRSGAGDEILSTTAWFLLVGHVWAAGSGTGAVHADTGLYTAVGVKIAVPQDFVWRAGTRRAVHRSYFSSGTTEPEGGSLPSRNPRL